MIFINIMIGLICIGLLLFLIGSMFDEDGLILSGVLSILVGFVFLVFLMIFLLVNKGNTESQPKLPVNDTITTYTIKGKDTTKMITIKPR